MGTPPITASTSATASRLPLPATCWMSVTVNSTVVVAVISPNPIVAVGAFERLAMVGVLTGRWEAAKATCHHCHRLHHCHTHFPKPYIRHHNSPLLIKPI